MSSKSSYWGGKSVTRRTALHAAAVAGGGAVALSIAGCGSDGEGGKSTGPSKSNELDWTKGKQGGTLVVQTNTFPNNFDFVGTNGGTRVAGFSYSGLLHWKAGKAGVDPKSLEPEPDIASALPEQPNDLTYVFKLRPGVKFHNGKVLTAEDVKYSLELWASDKSAAKDNFTWLDKVEATDAQTVTIKTKFPYADTLLNVIGYRDAFIFSKEYQESKEVVEKMMGTGPFIHTSTLAPVTVNFRRNPDYFMAPLPYFDQLSFQTITDSAKQVSDFITRQIHYTWYYLPESRDEIKRARPEAQSTTLDNFGHCVYLRCDQAPFTDTRVRQGLSMAIDRKQILEGVFSGEGQFDQALSIALSWYGFRKPSELKSARLWNYDPTEAKKLLSAAGVTSFDKQMTVASTPANQQTLQQATLIQAKWKELGIGNVRVVTVPTTQFSNTVNLGQYDDTAVFNNQQIAIAGIWLKNRFWAPPGGVKAPTQNVGYVNNPQLSSLLDKQLAQFKIEERRATFREVEEIIGDEQYRLCLTTSNQTWFMDPALKNADTFSFASNGTAEFTKYWWFDQG